MLQTEKIGLIIIDSIAAVFRVEDEYMERARDFRKMIQRLVDLSWQYDFAIVCVNQVSSNLETKEEFAPSLGVAWANLVTTRIQIYKDGRVEHDKNGRKVFDQRRVMKVIWAPHLPFDQATFFITSSGLTSAKGE